MSPAVAEGEVVVLKRGGVIAPGICIGLVQVGATVKLESNMEPVNNAVTSNEGAAGHDPVLSTHWRETVLANNVAIKSSF